MRYVKRLAVKAFLLLFCLPAAADVSLTQLANGGVVVSDGTTRIMIDGLVVEPYSIYAGLPPAARADFENLSGPFADIDLALASHRHHDHNQPAFACAFMQKSSGTRLLTSGQVIGLMREKCRAFVTSSERIVTIEPKIGEPVLLEQGSARITVSALSHGKRKYARIQHYAHRIDMGGVSLLHIGDGAMDPAAYEAAGFGAEPPDVALIPILYFQPGPGAALIDAYLDAPVKIAVQVPPAEVGEARAYLAEQFPGVRLLEPMDTLQLLPNPGATIAAE